MNRPRQPRYFVHDLWDCAYVIDMNTGRSSRTYSATDARALRDWLNDRDAGYP